jgi:hypothetical protein
MSNIKTGALSSRPNNFERKTVGIVIATVGEKRVKFEMVEEGKKFADGETSIKVNLEDLPVNPKLTTTQTGKQYRIRMNSAGDEVEALTPVNGVHRLRLIDIGPRPNGKDSDPEPYEKQSEWKGKDTSHLEFFSVYKITKGAFKGVQVPGFYLHYKFEDDGEGNTRFAGNTENPKATNLAKLVTWGNLHGMYDETIQWPEDGNILPILLERGLENDTEVDGLFKDGYIREVMPVQDDEEDEAPKKRTVADINKELGYEEEKPKTKKVNVPVDVTDLDVDKEFPKDEPKKAKKSTKKVVADDDDEDL